MLLFGPVIVSYNAKSSWHYVASGKKIAGRAVKANDTDCDLVLTYGSWITFV